MSNYPKATPKSSLAVLLRAMRKAGFEFENDCFTCPHHDDDKPSLSVMVGRKVPVVINCKVCEAEGEPQSAIIASLWGEIADYLPPGTTPSILSHEIGPERGKYLTPVGRGGNGGSSRTSDWKAYSHKVAEYVYADENNQDRIKVERWEPNADAPEGARKQFPTAWWDGRSWNARLPENIERIPYGLCDFEQAREDNAVVLLVEGEKNVHSIHAAKQPGVFATCFPGGAAGKLPSDWTDNFHGFRQVWVVADRDTPGIARALSLQASLEAAGIESYIVVSKVKTEHADVTDHLDAGFKLDDLIERTPEQCRREIARRQNRDGDTSTDTAKSLRERVNADPETEGFEGMVNPHADVYFNPDGTENYQRSDRGIAQYVVHTRGANIRYVPEKKTWYVFDGKCWRVDAENIIVTQVVKQTVEEMREQASRIVPNDDDEGKRMKSALTWCDRREDQGKLEAVVRSIKSEPDVVIDVHDLDAAPNLFSCKNGVLDLLTGEMRPHAEYRDEMITVIAPVAYKPNATHPEWVRFIDIVTDGDAELERFLKRAVCESLSGYTKSKKFVNLFDANRGNTGKTQFVQCVANMLGDYCTVVSPSAFAKTYSDRIPAELATTAGKRMVYVNEITSETRLDTSLLKDYTGGEIKLSFEQKYEKPWKAQATATLWMDGNSLGRVFSNDTALYGRWQMVEFTNDLPSTLKRLGHKPVLGWSAAMARDDAFQSAVLAWALSARAEWLSDGIGTTAGIKATVETQKAVVSGVGGFREALIPEAKARCSQNEVWSAYKEWAAEEGLARPMVRSEFLAYVESLDEIIVRPVSKKKFNSQVVRVFDNLRFDPDAI